MVRTGISLQMVGGVVLALIGVSVLLAMGNNMMGGGLFCSVYTSVSFVIPGQGGPPPERCGGGSDTDARAVEIRDHDRFATELTGAIIDCWQQYGGYRDGQTHLCAGWNVQNLESPVNEQDVTDTLTANGLCDQIGNTDVDPACGTADQVYFDGAVERGDYIIIRYGNVSGTERIEVR